MNKDELEKLVKESSSYVEMMKKLGYKCKGGNANIRLKNKVLEYGIDTSHFKGKAHGTSNTIIYLLKDILVENSKYNNNYSLKKRLLKEKLLEYKCYICGISSWLGKLLSLQLDHINGVNNDNRIENLRLLCPNCHSQTDTFSGRNVKK